MMGEPRRPAAPGDTTAAARPTRPVLVHAQLGRQIVRACHVVHQELGWGYLESIYEAALARVLRDSGLGVAQQQGLDVTFRGEVLGTFRADLVVEGSVLVELKSVRRIVPEHAAQVLNYLRGSGLRVGVLVNFAPTLEYRRFVR